MADPLDIVLTFFNAATVLSLCAFLAPLVLRARRRSARVLCIAVALEAGSMLWFAEWFLQLLVQTVALPPLWHRPHWDTSLNTLVAASYATAGWALLGLQERIRPRPPVAGPVARRHQLWQLASGWVWLAMVLAAIAALNSNDGGLAKSSSACLGFLLLGWGLWHEIAHVQPRRLWSPGALCCLSVFAYALLQLLQHQPTGSVLYVTTRLMAVAFKILLIVALWSVGNDIAEARGAARQHFRGHRVLWNRLAMTERLHEDVASRASALAKLLQLTSRKHASLGAAELAEMLDRNRRAAEALVGEIRGLLDTGMEAWSAEICPQGLEAALRERLSLFQEHAVGLGRRVQVDLTLSPSPLPRMTTEMVNGLYGIAVEAINNAETHSEATLITLAIRLNGEELEMVVENNGPLRSEERDGERASYGVNYMQALARWLGSRGPLLVEANDGGGMRVRVLLPYPPRHAPTP